MSALVADVIADAETEERRQDFAFGRVPVAALLRVPTCALGRVLGYGGTSPGFDLIL